MAIVIRSTREGFYRCGIPHAKASTTYPDDQFTKEEMERLIAEPKLSVSIVPDDTAPTDDIPDDTALQLDPSALAAARTAMENGDVIGSGAPDIKAMEAILKRYVSKDERDRAFDAIQAEDKA